jgi:hypothetical protein
MKTLVLGASSNPERYSNKAIFSLLQHGHQVEAIGNKQDVAHGVTIHKELIHVPDVHTVTLYLNPKNQEIYYDYIVTLNPKRVIFNPGTENRDLQELLRQNQIQFEEACTLVLLTTHQY